MAVRAGRALPLPARIARSGATLPLGLLAPSIIYLSLLILIPVAQALYLSVQAEDGAFTLENYDRMVHDAAFFDALTNTAKLLILIVPIQLTLALAMALLINSRFKGHGFFLYVYAIPLAISDLAAGIVWLSIFTENGYFNTILQGLGLIKEPISYLSYENLNLVLMTIVVAESWRATAIVMVILLAGLQLIPRDYFEAAELFGAGRWKRTLLVVLPLLRPSLQSALIIRTIFAFQTFAVVLTLAGRQFPVLAYEAYDSYANLFNPRVAAAWAGLILILTLAVVIFYLRIFKVREQEVAR